MTATVKWNFISANKYSAVVDGMTDVIQSVRYEVLVSDDAVPNGPKGSFFGNINLDKPTDPTKFIPSASVTKAVLVQWVKDKLGAINVAAQEKLATEKYNLAAAPVLSTFTPAG